MMQQCHLQASKTVKNLPQRCTLVPLKPTFIPTFPLLQPPSQSLTHAHLDFGIIHMSKNKKKGKYLKCFQDSLILNNQTLNALQ